MLALPAQEAVAASPEADSAPSTEGQQALAEAEESGQRVEVAGERTDRTTVYANPDGFTFTLEQSAVPIRVAKAGGGWQAPDATLEKRSDGSVGPKAAAVSIAFSAGVTKRRWRGSRIRAIRWNWSGRASFRPRGWTARAPYTRRYCRVSTCK